MKILIVDDEYVSRVKLKAILSTHGECDSAENGATALELLKSAYQRGEPYELVTMDISMPDMSGHSVVQDLREWEQTHKDASHPQSKILMITATKDIHDVMSSFSEGAEQYIIKPVTPEKLQEALVKINILSDAAPDRPVKPAQKKAQAQWRVDKPSSEDDLCSKLHIPSVQEAVVDTYDEDFLNEYLDSTWPKLNALEETALQLESGGDPTECTQSIMRTLHSLKGEAGMIGLGKVSQVCHETEDIVKADGSAECVDFVLRVKDWVEKVALYLCDPNSVDLVEDTAEEPSPPVSDTQAQEGPHAPQIKRPEPKAIDFSRLIEDFLPDYLQSTRARVMTLEQAICTMANGGSALPSQTEVFNTLNALKGEAAMIGLSEVQDVVRETEEACKKFEFCRECSPIVLETKRWLESVLCRLEGLQKTKA